MLLMLVTILRLCDCLDWNDKHHTEPKVKGKNNCFNTTRFKERAFFQISMNIRMFEKIHEKSSSLI